MRRFNYYKNKNKKTSLDRELVWLPQLKADGLFIYLNEFSQEWLKFHYSSLIVVEYTFKTLVWTNHPQNQHPFEIFPEKCKRLFHCTGFKRSLRHRRHGHKINYWERMCLSEARLCAQACCAAAAAAAAGFGLPALGVRSHMSVGGHPRASKTPLNPSVRDTTAIEYK